MMLSANKQSEFDEKENQSVLNNFDFTAIDEMDPS